MASLIGPGGAPLDSGRHIAIVEHRIIMPNDVVLVERAMVIPESVAYLRVIDIPRATALYVPLTAEQCQHLAEGRS